MIHTVAWNYYVVFVILPFFLTTSVLQKKLGGLDWKIREIIIPSDVRPAPFQNHTPAPHKQIYTTHMLLLSTILEIKVEEEKKYELGDNFL